MKPHIYTSSSMGKNDFFTRQLQDREQTVSITIDDGFDFTDTSQLKIYIQIEPPEVIDVVDTLLANKDFYDVILAWDTRILDGCPKAIFFPHCETLGPPLRLDQ